MADMIQVLIADSSPEIRSNIKNALALNQQIKVLAECGDGETAVKMTLEMVPDIVILDYHLPLLDGISASELINASLPSVSIILISNEYSELHMKNAMGAGARAYIKKPFSEAAMAASVVQIYEKNRKLSKTAVSRKYQTLSKKTQIITVFSTKGGVGKTTIASNLAVALAQKTSGRVVLLDLDLQFGDVPILLNLNPKKTILELTGEISNLNRELLDEYLLEHESGLKVLPAPINPEYSEYINGQIVEKIIRQLCDNYRYIIIDTAPVFNDINLTVMDLSDQIFFIATLDLSTIKNVKAGLQVMRKLKYSDSKVRIVLNRYHRHFGISPQDVEKTFGKPISYLIPEDSVSIIQAMNNGVPFVTANGSTKPAKRIQEMAGDILGDQKSERKGLFKSNIHR